MSNKMNDNKKNNNQIKSESLSAFEKGLKEKITQTPNSLSMDKLFYERLEALPEKSPQAVSWLVRLKMGLTLQNLVPGLASVAVCVVLIGSVLRLERPELTDTGDGYAQIIQMEEALDNMELMSELEEIPTSEEDWAILLGDSAEAEGQGDEILLEEST